MSAESDCVCRGTPLAPSLRFLIQLGSLPGSFGAIRELGFSRVVELGPWQTYEVDDGGLVLDLGLVDAYVSSTAGGYTVVGGIAGRMIGGSAKKSVSVKSTRARDTSGMPIW